MDHKQLETWAWVLIYGGMVLVGLGIGVQQLGGQAHGLAWTLLALGGLGAAAGVLMIWWRSRLGDR